MGLKRIVDTSFWTDGKVDEFTPEDKYFMLYLLTNPFSKQLGIYEISIKQVAFQMGYSTDAVKALLDRFENKYGIIIFSKSTNEIAIKNFLRHSIIKGGKPVEDCIKKEMLQVKSKSLISKVFRHLFGREDLNETVRKIISEYPIEVDIDNDIENDNDNDNDVSYHVRATNRERIVDDSSISEDSQPESYEAIKEEIMESKGLGDKVCEWCGCKTTVLHKHHYPVPKRMGGKDTVNICSNCHHEFHLAEGKKPSKPKPTRHKYGLYKNVLLSDEDLDKVKIEFPNDWEQRIERLSEYMATTGKPYKNHLAVIRSWARRANEEKIKKKPKTGNPFYDLVIDEFGEDD